MSNFPAIDKISTQVGEALEQDSIDLRGGSELKFWGLAPNNGDPCVFEVVITMRDIKEGELK